jgi:hypothetical protein
LRFRKFQSGFAHLPVAELLLFRMPKQAQERVRTAKLARRVEGRMPGRKGLAFHGDACCAV